MARWLMMTLDLPVDVGLAAATGDVADRAAVSPGDPGSLTLLGGFTAWRDGRPVILPPSAQQVVAVLACHSGGHRRAHVVAKVWPDISEVNGAAALRTALWRTNQAWPGLVRADQGWLRLDPGVRCDVSLLVDQAYAVLTPGDRDLTNVDHRAFCDDLLPDWDDTWVGDERERFRHLRLNVLEALCARHTATGAYGLAVEVGIAAVGADPLRETAHRVLVLAHLAVGNRVEAERQVQRYRAELQRAGLPPSVAVEGLLVR